MNNVSKFGLLFYSETDAAVQGIDKLAGSFKGLETVMLAAENTTKHAFGSIFGFLEHYGMKVVETAAEFQKSRELFKFAFMDDDSQASMDRANEKFDRVRRVALGTTQTFQELTDATKMLKTMGGVDIFSGKLDEMAAGGKMVDKLGHSVGSFLNVVADAASRNAFGINGVVYGFSNIAHGNMGQQTMRRLHMSNDTLVALKKSLAGVTDEQKRMEIAAPILAKEFGGATDYLKKHSIAFMIPQFKDVEEQLSLTFGEGALNKFYLPFKSILDFFSDEVLAMPKKIQGITDAFTSVGAALSFVLGGKDGQGGLVAIGKGLFRFIQARPEVLKMVFAFTAVLGAITAIMSVVLALKVAFIALTVTGPWTLLIGAIGVGAYFLAKWAVHGKSIKDTFERIILVGKGVIEIITTMRGDVAQLSEETAAAADSQGLLGLIVKIGMFGYRVKEFFESVGSTLSSNFELIRHAFVPLFDRIQKMFGNLSGAATSSTDKWKSAGAVVGEALTGIAIAGAKVLDVLVGVGAFIAEHKVSLMLIAGAFAAIKVGGSIVSGIGGLRGGMMGAAAGFAGVPRVFVVNMPGDGIGGVVRNTVSTASKLPFLSGLGSTIARVGSGAVGTAAGGLGAGLAGMMAGNFLGGAIDDKAHLSDKLGSFLARLSQSTDPEVDAKIKNARFNHPAAFERRGNIQINNYIDGKKVSERLVETNQDRGGGVSNDVNMSGG